MHEGGGRWVGSNKLVELKKKKKKMAKMVDCISIKSLKARWPGSGPQPLETRSPYSNRGWKRDILRQLGSPNPLVGAEGSQECEKNCGETQAAPSTIRPQGLVWSEMTVYQSEYSHLPLGVQHIRKLRC